MAVLEPDGRLAPMTYCVMLVIGNWNHKAKGWNEKTLKIGMHNKGCRHR
jgi:hypothetical protein